MFSYNNRLNTRIRFYFINERLKKRNMLFIFVKYNYIISKNNKKSFYRPIFLLIKFF